MCCQIVLKLSIKHILTTQDYAKRIRPSSGNSKKGKNAKARASMTLKDLVDVGVILPGRNKISVFYKGINYVASLGKDGIIVYQGMHYWHYCMPRYAL